MKTHKPVLVEEILSIFEQTSIRYFVDGTLGAGGHARALLLAHPEIERYIGCDRDPEALRLAKIALSDWQDKIDFIHGSYTNIPLYLKEKQIPFVDGMLIDAGVSSMQITSQERGFSFQGNGPLDMRMNPEDTLTASHIINCWKEIDLIRILQEYGEEPKARLIVRAIVHARKYRPIETTKELVDLLTPVIGTTRGKKHLHAATLTFQALRIAVNNELFELNNAVEQGVEFLSPQGRIAVISFHRLEDRIVKVCFKKEGSLVRKNKYTLAGVSKNRLKLLTKKPITPTLKEIKSNPRCRSAKLRAAEKM